MCGICGILDLGGGDPPRADVLGRMCQAIVHRGPDGEGVYVDGPVGLGNRRLAIIDLAGGVQPMFNEDRSIAIVFNGEIYNFQSLYAELRARGHRFRSACDTETIVHAYEEYGDDCVQRLRGMFAFALWDGRRRRLLIARDRLGKKPLYYALHERRLLFGSELKSLLAVPGFHPPIDPRALDCFFTLEYVPAPLTILQGVRKLPGGHLLTVEDGVVSTRPYWNVRFAPRDVPEPVAAETLRDILTEAVRIRMISDVPLGAFLSGGIDSSIVVGLMSRLSDRPVKTFSIGFANGSYNELAYARLVAERFGTEHHEMVLTPDIGELAVRLLAHADEPLADTSLFPTYLVSAFARQSVTVALSGDGGDEVFAGYDWYAAQKAARYYGLLPGAVRGRLLPALLDRVPPSEAKKGLANVSKRFVAGANRPADLEHARWLVYLDPEERERFYAPGFLAEVGAFDPLGVLRRHFADARTSDPLARQIYVDLKTFLVDDIMVKVDRMSMATSLEARAPFLDHEFVEFAASLPSRLKMRRFERKYLLKRAFADLLPEAILRRDKQGFSSPVKNWLRAELRPMLLDVVSPERLRAEGYVEPAYVERLVREHLAGTHDHGHRLWALVVFGLWHEQYRTGSGWAPEARLGRDALKYGAAAVAD